MSGPIQANSPATGLVPVQRVRRQVEADLNLTTAGNRFKIDGDVFLGKSFLPKVIERALNRSGEFRNASIAYKADKDRYELTGEIKAAGLWIDVKASTQPVMEGNDLVLRNVQFDFPGSSINWVSNKARDAIASVLKGEGIIAAHQGNDIRLGATSVLREAGVLPRWAILSDDTSGRISHDADGNLALHFGAGAAGAPDGTSHIKAHLDPATVRRVLPDVLGNDYQMSGATFESGHIKVQGKAAVRDIQTAVNGFAVLLAAVAGDREALARGHLPMDQAPLMDLGLDIAHEGSTLVVTPSTSLAIKPIAKDLGQGGASVTTTKHDVRMDAGALLPEGKIHSIEVDASGVHLDAEVNLDSTLNPALK